MKINRYDNIICICKTQLIGGNGGSRSEYVPIFTQVTEAAKYMDCNTLGISGYVAIVNEVDDDDHVQDTSPIYQITNDTVTPVQYFAQMHQNRVRLR